MAQKGIAYLNKVGISQYWTSSWNSLHNYSITQREFWLIEFIIRNFISQRFSFHKLIINLDLCWDQIIEWECEYTKTDVESLNYLVRRTRAKRSLFPIVGEIIFIRIQGWLVIIIFLFKPRSKKNIIKKTINFMVNRELSRRNFFLIKQNFKFKNNF